MAENGGWKADKHVNLAMIGAVGMQTAIIVWGASSLWTRVGNIEEAIKSSAHQAEKIAVIEEKVTTLQGVVSRLEDWLRHNIKPSQP